MDDGTLHVSVCAWRSLDLLGLLWWCLCLCRQSFPLVSQADSSLLLHETPLQLASSGLTGATRAARLGFGESKN
ncbi:hypothetical protein CCUS01_16437 [Colletotrichum cuscutae]|uniref:Uncharacterized protein n=1 Tax=Colletotrichum cuscutae TaxID=1209917 RepID=A0AAI9V9K3_9PEZI|nr:hypothetical protein CCUS01_16437 [Colletotrichum cuscutae]